MCRLGFFARTNVQLFLFNEFGGAGEKRPQWDCCKW